MSTTNPNIDALTRVPAQSTLTATPASLRCINSYVPPSPDASVRRATLRDHPYIYELAKRHSNAIGFVPGEGIKKYIEQECVTLSRFRGQHAGYLLARHFHSGDRSIRHIVQAAISFDAQRLGNGLALVADLATAAKRSGQSILQCWCRESLDANHFWSAAGFVAVARRHASTGRKSPCLLWRRPLDPLGVETLRRIPRQHRLHGPGGIWISQGEGLQPQIELLNGHPYDDHVAHVEADHGGIVDDHSRCAALILPPDALAA